MSPSTHRFVDTNILLRFLTNDLPEQAELNMSKESNHDLILIVKLMHPALITRIF